MESVVFRSLSPREHQTLDMLASGLTFKESAPLLGVSINTAGTYAKRAYAKLGVTRKRDAIRVTKKALIHPMKRTHAALLAM